VSNKRADRAADNSRFGYRLADGIIMSYKSLSAVVSQGC